MLGLNLLFSVRKASSLPLTYRPFQLGFSTDLKGQFVIFAVYIELLSAVNLLG